MNCPEFINIVKSGQPIIFRRNSKEYVRITENSLSVITEHGEHLCLWLSANRKFKRMLRTLGGESNIINFKETHRFLNQWQEIREARDWSSDNFPSFYEIATFAYLTLVPEYWTIYLEVEGKPAEEVLPLIEHESIHSDSSGYDF